MKFLFLPEGDDPDSYVRREGSEAFEQVAGEALPLSEFGIKELTDRVDMGSAEGRAKFLQDAKPLVKQIAAPILGLMLRRRMAELAWDFASRTRAALPDQNRASDRRVPALAARRGRSQPIHVRQHAGTGCWPLS